MQIIKYFAWNLSGIYLCWVAIIGSHSKTTMAKTFEVPSSNLKYYSSQFVRHSIWIIKTQNSMAFTKVCEIYMNMSALNLG